MEDDPPVNTTHRHNVYCREEASDGRVCSLYSPHFGKPKHGVEADRFETGE